MKKFNDYTIEKVGNYDYQIYDENGEYVDSEESHEAATHLIERLIKEQNKEA